jgi:hypothetical protein
MFSRDNCLFDSGELKTKAKEEYKANRPKKTETDGGSADEEKPVKKADVKRKR